MRRRQLAPNGALAHEDMAQLTHEFRDLDDALSLVKVATFHPTPTLTALPLLCFRGLVK